MFVQGGKHLFSKEGTTQGDPAAMSIYALGIAPLLMLLLSSSQQHQLQYGLKNKQVVYADDMNGIGKLKAIRQWWDILVQEGPKYGYLVNPPKSYLIVKEKCYEEVK